MTEAAASKPEVDFPTGEAPTELTIRDITVGDGAEAVPGAKVRVHYLGVEFATRRGVRLVLESRRVHRVPAPRPDPGLAGRHPRDEGRRPPRAGHPAGLAYGPAGGGHRLSGQTLIFVIDLLGVS